MSDNDTNKSPTETPRGFGEYRSKTKPLRWRTGPVDYPPKDCNEPYLVKRKSGEYVLRYYFSISEGDHWLPLSDILDLIGGE